MKNFRWVFEDWHSANKFANSLVTIGSFNVNLTTQRLGLYVVTWEVPCAE